MAAVTPAPAASTGLRAVRLGSTNDTLVASVGRVAQVQDATPDPGVHDILVVDANGRAGLGTDATVKSFLGAGKTVVFLNVSSRQKGDTLGLHTSLMTKEGSRAFALRRATDKFGHPEFFALDWPEGHTDKTNPMFEGELTKWLKAPSAVASDPGPPSNGLLCVTFNYSITPVPIYFSVTRYQAPGNNSTTWPNPQVNAFTSNYTFQLYLENANQATGNRQWLVVRNNLVGSPSNAALGPTGMEAQTYTATALPTDSNKYVADVGWFQSWFGTSISPNNASLFNWFRDSPANANQVTQITDSASFDLDFLTPEGGGGATFSYSHSDSYDVTQWRVFNLGQSQQGNWAFACQDPYQMDTTKDTSTWLNEGRGGGIKDGSDFRVPNNLSLNQFQAHTQVVWTTNGVLTDNQEFGTLLQATYGNPWQIWEKVFSEYGYYLASVGAHGDWEESYSTPTFTLDMGDIVPLNITTVDFSPNVVQTTPTQNTATVNATVSLAAPAPINTTVYLSTQNNSQNAEMPPSVIIPQGERSTTFQILVNNNGLTPNQSYAVFVKAFNGTYYQTQFSIRN